MRDPDQVFQEQPPEKQRHDVPDGVAGVEKMADVVDAAVGEIFEDHPEDLGDDVDEKQVPKRRFPALFDIL